MYQAESVDVPQALEDLIQAWYGQFTQFVWARSHRLGCGAYTTLTNPQKFFLVCDYFRAGNVLGQNTFTAGAQLGSNCPPGTAQGGSNGLCRVIDEAQFNTYAG